MNLKWTETKKIFLHFYVLYGCVRYKLRIEGKLLEVKSHYKTPFFCKRCDP